MIHICFALLFILAFSNAHAEVPDIVSEQKNAVVTVYVDDKNGNHISTSSGFIVDQSGVIVTDCRIIVKWFEAVQNVLNVETKAGLHFPIEDLISSRCENNLALFKVGAKGLPAVKLAPDYKTGKGEGIFVVGSLSESETDFTEGIVKSVHEKDKLVQISIPVAPGMSGSPVLNIKGEAVGAVIFLPKKGKHLNFAVSLKGMAKQLDRYRKLAKIEMPAPIYTPAAKPEVESDAKQDKLKKKAEKEADAADAYFQRGCSYQELNMHKEAIKEYMQAVKIKPDYAEAYANLGLAYYKLGKYSDAVSAYKNAIQIRPDAVSVYIKLGAAYIINGTYAMARETLKKATDIDPGDAVAHYNLGIAYLLNGETIDAFREYLILKDIDNERANSLKDLF